MGPIRVEEAGIILIKAFSGLERPAETESEEAVKSK
jgi:hypothetical protein